MRTGQKTSFYMQSETLTKLDKCSKDLGISRSATIAVLLNHYNTYISLCDILQNGGDVYERKQNQI